MTEQRAAEALLPAVYDWRFARAFLYDAITMRSASGRVINAERGAT
jgi:hypothetical protein